VVFLAWRGSTVVFDRILALLPTYSHGEAVFMSTKTHVCFGCSLTWDCDGCDTDETVKKCHACLEKAAEKLLEEHPAENLSPDTLRIIEKLDRIIELLESIDEHQERIDKEIKDNLTPCYGNR
jgi:hypothetical protein